MEKQKNGKYQTILISLILLFSPIFVVQCKTVTLDGDNYRGTIEISNREPDQKEKMEILRKGLLSCADNTDTLAKQLVQERKDHEKRVLKMRRDFDKEREDLQNRYIEMAERAVDEARADTELSQKKMNTMLILAGLAVTAFGMFIFLKKT